MIRLFKYTTAKLWLLLLLLIILGGITVAFGRLMAPMAELYRQDVEQWASRTLGQPVKMGFIEGHWRGLGPELTLHNVALLNPETGKPTLKLDEIKVRLALVESLRNRAVTLRKLTLINPRLLIKRRTDGSIIIEGLQDIGEQQGPAGGALLLPSSVALKRGVIHWENQAIGAAPLRFTDVDMELRNDGARHQFNGSLNLPGEMGAKISIAADIRGELEQPDAWSGDAYLKGEKLVLAKLLKHRLPEGYSFDRGQAMMEIWSHWEEGRMHQIQGNLQLNDTRLALRNDQTPGTQKAWDFDRLGGDFSWNRNQRGWRFDIQNILFQHQDGSWPDTWLFINTDRSDDGGLLLSAGADFLRVEDLLSLTSMFPLPDPTLEEALTAIAPHGDISELQINYRETAQGPRWQGAGTLQGMSTQPWNSVPGVENLSARIWSDGEKGIIRLLNTGSVALEFPGLFRDPLQIDRLGGNIEWQQLDDQNWRIESRNLAASNSDISTRTRFRLDLPLDNPAAALLDLQSDFENGDAANASRYYPTGIMPEEAVAWLDRSIVSGRVTSGSALFRGPLGDFPFETAHNGRFEVLFNTQDLNLAYWPEWPALTSLEAEVRFLNNRFDAWIQSGNIYDSLIQQAHGAIPDLENTAPLKVTGQVQGKLSNTLRLLKESPLKEQFGPMTKGIEAAGDSTLKLDLTVPLLSSDSYKLTGELAFNNSGLNLEEWKLPLSGITGTLNFDLDRVYAKGIRGELFGNPITADVSTPPEQNNATRISATTLISKQELEQQFPDFNIDQLHGAGEVTLQIDLPNISGWNDSAVPVQITSDLKGFSLDLPHPLGKTEEERRSVSIATQLGDKKSKHSILRLDYGNLLSAALAFDEAGRASRLLGGEIVLGDGKARLSGSNRLDIKGGWKRLELSPWLDLLPEPAQGDTTLLPGDIDLSFNQLTLNDLELDNFRIKLKGENNAFKGSLSSDLLSGNLEIPGDLEKGTVRLRMKHLNLKLEPDHWSSRDQERTSDIDPSTIPSIDATVEKLSINGKDYGKLTLLSQKQSDRMTLEQLSLVSKETSIQASGEWKGGSQESKSTQLDLSLESADFGVLLKDLGFTANLEEAASKINAQINWPGSPLEFSSGNLNGNLNMALGSGRFLQVNPGVGRIFGLLNITALQRRLTLDFSDMLQEGFTFDRIEGDFIIEDGNAYTENFLMKGPAATIDIAGRIGLGSEDFDQLITVTPMISSSLPLAGAWAGGPAVGAALLVAHKLFGEKFDEATQVQYSVTGPWEKPEITGLEKETPENENQMIAPDLLPSTEN
ncbi:MAG: YhdP family protein [Candidatus Sedimenticola sp. PURPLELP]